MKYLLIFFLVWVPHVAAAASISFEPQDFSAGPGSPFIVAVNATSDEYVNVFSIVLDIPQGLTPVDVSDGNSIISLFVEQPHFDELSRTLSFSGVIPGGFSGEAGRLVAITFVPENTEVTTALKLNSLSVAYAGEGISVPLSADALMLPVISGKHNLRNTLPDTDAPEEFSVVVASDPLIQEGKKVLIFSTTDKGSGMARFLVKEGFFGDLFHSFGWHEAESPYVLRDQAQTHHVYVRAIDKAGNEYVAYLPPTRLPFGVYTFIVLALCMLLFWYVQSRTRS